MALIVTDPESIFALTKLSSWNDAIAGPTATIVGTICGFIILDRLIQMISTIAHRWTGRPIAQIRPRLVVALSAGIIVAIVAISIFSWLELDLPPSVIVGVLAFFGLITIMPSIPILWHLARIARIKSSRSLTTIIIGFVLAITITMPVSLVIQRVSSRVIMKAALGTPWVEWVSPSNCSAHDDGSIDYYFGLRYYSGYFSPSITLSSKEFVFKIHIVLRGQDIGIISNMTSSIPLYVLENQKVTVLSFHSDVVNQLIGANKDSQYRLLCDLTINGVGLTSVTNGMGWRINDIRHINDYIYLRNF